MKTFHNDDTCNARVHHKYTNTPSKTIELSTNLRVPCRKTSFQRFQVVRYISRFVKIPAIVKMCAQIMLQKVIILMKNAHFQEFVIETGKT